MFFIQGMDMKFLRAALTMAKTAVYSLHKTSTREVSSVSTPLTFTGQMEASPNQILSLRKEA